MRTVLTGRELGQRRLTIGISALAVARALGVHPSTLALWERDLDVLEPKRAARWEDALRICAQQRAAVLARQGWKTGDLPHAGLRSTMRQYVK
jgi:hypothetical protein